MTEYQLLVCGVALEVLVVSLTLRIFFTQSGSSSTTKVSKSNHTIGLNAEAKTRARSSKPRSKE